MTPVSRSILVSGLLAGMSVASACSGGASTSRADAGIKQSSTSSAGSQSATNMGTGGHAGGSSTSTKGGTGGQSTGGAGKGAAGKGAAGKGTAGTGTGAGTGGTGGKGSAGTGMAGTGTAGASTAGVTGGSGGAAPDGTVVTYGQVYEGGQFNLGPVDYDETQWHNACAPSTKYAPAIRSAEGSLLAGLWNGIANVADYCDACISVKTAMGKSAVLRVVTYGDTTTNSIDVSPDAFAILDSGEYPRTMTWQLARCPDTGKVVYEFQTGSSEWWTSLWVRNARVPLTLVEVKSPNHASYAALTRGSDGTLTDASGFGNGPFSIRLTAVDGQTLIDSFDWPAQGIAGQVLTGQGNLQ